MRNSERSRLERGSSQNPCRCNTERGRSEYSRSPFAVVNRLDRLFDLQVL